MTPQDLTPKAKLSKPSSLPQSLPKLTRQSGKRICPMSWCREQTRRHRCFWILRWIRIRVQLVVGLAEAKLITIIKWLRIFQIMITILRELALLLLSMVWMIIINIFHWVCKTRRWRQRERLTSWEQASMNLDLAKMATTMIVIGHNLEKYNF